MYSRKDCLKSYMCEYFQLQFELFILCKYKQQNCWKRVGFFFVQNLNLVKWKCNFITKQRALSTLTLKCSGYMQEKCPQSPLNLPPEAERPMFPRTCSADYEALITLVLCVALRRWQPACGCGRDKSLALKDEQISGIVAILPGLWHTV